MRLVRQLHTTRALGAFVRKSGDANSGSVFKRGTPAKERGWIHDFEYVAAHSKLARFAPNPQVEGFDDLFAKDSSSGSVYKFPAKISQALSTFGSFRRDQRHELFKNRTTLARQDTTARFQAALDQAATQSSDSNRFCLLGDAGVGKSTLLTQIQASALARQYIVMAVSRPIELVNGETDAVFNKDLDVFSQPMYIRRWLKRFANGNFEVLSQIPLSEGRKKVSTRKVRGKAPNQNWSLYDFVMESRGRKDLAVAMHEIMEELETQTTSPVLFTMDDINVFAHHIYAQNRDAKNHPIYHGRLQMPRYFLDFLSGERRFQAGAVVAATSGSYRLNETILAGLGLCAAPAYAKINRFDLDLATKFAGVSAFTVPRYTVAETETLLKYWGSVNMLNREVSPEVVRQRYLLSGNGNARSLLAACVFNF